MKDQRQRSKNRWVLTNNLRYNYCYLLYPQYAQLFLVLSGDFFLANISMKVVLGMLFITLSNADVQFTNKELTWGTYNTKEALSITRRVKPIDQNRLAKAVLDEKIKVFVMYVSSLESKMTIKPVRKLQLALLLAKKVTVLAKYLYFVDILLEKSANILPEQIGVNEHAIKLEKGKKIPYRPIYRLKLVEFKSVKIYIETNLANGFIRDSKSPAVALILFVSKPNGSFCLCVNYQGLNNLTIKNWYLLPLIGKFLAWLGQAKQFT